MTSVPIVAADALAWIDTDQMREIDRIMIEDLHIELLQMMENAGRALATVVLDRSAPATVAVYAGRGGNGGGGLVAARHLANAGSAALECPTGRCGFPRQRRSPDTRRNT